LELIAQAFSSFDPDQAVGVNLDRRVAINGVKRAGGSYTQQPVTIVVDRALTLLGMDSNPTTPFTVQDPQGNQYQLVTTHAFSGAGTEALTFQAVEVGSVSSALNTITDVVTVTLGVVSVNNPSTAYSVGVTQESDPALRTRRSRSVSIPSKGYLDGLIGSLLDLVGVTQVEVFENVTNVEDLRGIPPHAIWVIVQGGDADEIAQVIYVKRSLGCNMRGAVSIPITQLDGLVLNILFDRPIEQDLFIQFNVEPITGVIDLGYLRARLLEALSYGINQAADTARIVKLIKEIYPNASVSEEGVSTDDLNFYSLVSPETVQHQFSVAEIAINGTVS